MSFRGHVAGKASQRLLLVSSLRCGIFSFSLHFGTCWFMFVAALKTCVLKRAPHEKLMVARQLVLIAHDVKECGLDGATMKGKKRDNIFEPTPP